MASLRLRGNPLLSSSSILSLCLLSLLSIATSTDTITSDSSLSGTNQKLISAQGKFALGFYQPTSSSNWYIAIWYNTISVQTPVFIANRNAPLTDPATSQLTIGTDGNLVLINGSKTEVWSTNVSGINPSNKTQAVLDDNGNLVLSYVSNTSNVLWQSIDNPTDTWLPGGKLGLNKTTGISQRLISWKSSTDPAEGIYSLLLDPNGTSQYFIQWNKTEGYWTSGTWSETQRIFTLVPEMTENFVYNFTYVSNSQENYFTYSIKSGTNVTSRFIMDHNGQIQQQNWVDTTQQWILFWSQPRQTCQVYALCGPYGSCNENGLPYCNCLQGFTQKSQSDYSMEDYSGGCVRKTKLQCESSDPTKVPQDKFYVLYNMKLPNNSQSMQVNSAAECESACLKSCSCSAYSYKSRCNLWYGGLLNLQDGYTSSDGGTLYLRLAASEFSASKSNKGLIIGTIVGSIVVILFFIVVVMCVMKRRRDQRAARLLKESRGTLIAFRYDDLQYVTKNFSEKLGGGAFGSVYKGLLPDSTAIAVKRLDGFHQGEKQFRAEVSTIGTIQHVNLVRLIGFCSEASCRLLVYEYMPNSSLDTKLFNTRDALLNWSTRYQIALGTARGLAYLHEKCRDCIIHCDIKPENILLDDNFVPKVADFGLSKLLGRDFSRVLTTMRGTRGYLAPEWITGVPITPKADVFSYGMMLFELISGHRNNSDQGDGKLWGTGFFPSFAARKLIEGDVQTLLDQKLNGEAPIQELERACKVACWCIQDDETSRPTMGQVVQILEGILEVNTPPMPISLRVMGESPDYINFFSDMSSSATSKTQSTSAASSLVKNSS
ncbi:Serine/threonine-protein kinase [Rhynchospora pubera]|uniref:Receptor-like serine/threonine-protein kinase n=1 Tax=Rhynchospora pubera TaxID=906938 RepID=A0AAV8CYF3_9POAL|nr:Serine/threonine-protein kinase [Rhynchospora pubera]